VLKVLESVASPNGKTAALNHFPDFRSVGRAGRNKQAVGKRQLAKKVKD
jgi:hypothetical protein